MCIRDRLNTINNSNVLLDGLIGSNLDPGEVFSFSELSLKPKYTIKTEGEKGGIIFPGGRYKALKNKKPVNKKKRIMFSTSRFLFLLFKLLI